MYFKFKDKDAEPSPDDVLAALHMLYKALITKKVDEKARFLSTHKVAFWTDRRFHPQYLLT